MITSLQSQQCSNHVLKRISVNNSGLILIGCAVDKGRSPRLSAAREIVADEMDVYRARERSRGEPCGHKISHTSSASRVALKSSFYVLQASGDFNIGPSSVCLIYGIK
jgi:hypothetical protein